MPDQPCHRVRHDEVSRYRAVVTGRVVTSLTTLKLQCESDQRCSCALSSPPRVSMWKLPWRSEEDDMAFLRLTLPRKYLAIAMQPCLRHLGRYPHAQQHFHPATQEQAAATARASATVTGRSNYPAGRQRSAGWITRGAEAAGRDSREVPKRCHFSP